MLRSQSLDLDQVRKDFPILTRKIHGKRLVYLDNAATSQKPSSVIKSIAEFYRKHNANPHRGVHQLSIESTEAYDEGRKKVMSFVNAAAFEEIVFTRSATESLNLVKYAWAAHHVKKGDLIVLTIMEHHSNMVPWQLLAKEVGATIEYVGITPEGYLRYDQFEALMERSPALVAFTQCSNLLGTINDVSRLCSSARRAGAVTVVDGAQSVPHMPVDVQGMGCDFLAFSVAGDTPVLVKQDKETKLIPIRNAVKLHRSGKNISVLTLSEAGEAQFQPVTGALSHRDELYKITYENSALPVLATAHHSIYVWRNGDICAEKVSGLRSGDYLVTLSGQRVVLPESKPEIELNYTHDGNAVSEIVQITPNLMRLVGYYLAEGSIDPAGYRISLTFSQDEDAFLEDSRTLIGELEPTQYYSIAAGLIKNLGPGQQTVMARTAGVSRRTVNKYLTSDGQVGLAHTHAIGSHVYYNQKNHTANVFFNSKKWYEFFSKFCGTRINKHLPDFVWSLRTDLIVELLRGYLRGDASKNERYRLRAKSVSKRMITEFSWLLKLHGVSNSLGFEKSQNPKWHDTYSLVIQRSALAGIKEFYRKNVKPDSPKDALICVDGLRRAYKISKAKYNYWISSTIRRGTKRTTRDSALKVVEWIESTHSRPITSEIQLILNRYRVFARGDFGLVKVRSIKPAGRKAVFDVSVQGTERFFGGYYPVLLHNSGHKMLGPTGIGVLYARKAILQEMEPFQSGGDMIKSVHLSGAEWNDLPYRFEAGTQNVEGAVGLAAAIDYLNALGMDRVRRHEQELTSYALERMQSVPGITVYGPEDASKRGGVVSFNLGDVHPHDLASILDEEGVAIRSGQHCAQPLTEYLGLSATTRASFYVYNGRDDVDALMKALSKARRIFCL